MAGVLHTSVFAVPVLYQLLLNLYAASYFISIVLDQRERTKIVVRKRKRTYVVELLIGKKTLFNDEQNTG